MRSYNPSVSLTRGALPSDSTPKRCNTLHLSGKGCEKEYEQIVSTPFAFRQVKPALWKTPLRCLFSFDCRTTPFGRGHTSRVCLRAAKLADCAYRHRRYIARRGDVPFLGTKPRERSKPSPSGKLCMQKFALSRRARRACS